MAYPAQKYQATPQLGNPARTEAWALRASARDLSHSKTGSTDQFLETGETRRAVFDTLMRKTGEIID